MPWPEVSEALHFVGWPMNHLHWGERERNKERERRERGRRRREGKLVRRRTVFHHSGRELSFT